MAENSKMPFYCGSQHADWQEKNCGHCKKDQKCDIQDALYEAYVGDGTVTESIAARMNYTPEQPGYYCWPCNEVESTTEEHPQSVQYWRELRLPAARKEPAE